MRYLIVNGDDFGASPGVNRGHPRGTPRGILTSTSLMVDMPWAEQAAVEARNCPGLSVGLHVCLTNEEEQLVVDPADSDGCRDELRRQFRRFRDLMGGPPSPPRFAPQYPPRSPATPALPRAGSGVRVAPERTLSGPLLLEFLRAVGRGDAPGAGCGG